MEPASKYAISHRARAFDHFAGVPRPRRRAGGRGGFRRLRALAVLRPEVPLLRLQQPRPFRRHRRGALSRRVPARAGALGADWRRGPRFEHLLRRRHAIADGTGDGRRDPRADRALWSVEPDAEITLEANPVERRGRALPRLSRGGRQSRLARRAVARRRASAVSRPHSFVAEAKAAIEIARATFDRFSFDLIYARPGQTLDAWSDELRPGTRPRRPASVALSAHHRAGDAVRSAARARQARCVPDEDAAPALYETTQELTARAGLPAYEVSNHAAPGEESRHNLLYWRYGEYAGSVRVRMAASRSTAACHATVTERHPERWARASRGRPRHHRGRRRCALPRKPTKHC